MSRQVADAPLQILKKWSISPEKKAACRFILKQTDIPELFGTPPVSRIILQAEVTPKLQVEPSFLNLQGLSPKQDPIIKVVHIKNNSDGPIDINEIKTTNDHLVVSVSKLRIAAGAVDSLQVKYTPWKSGRDDSIILFRRNKRDGHTLQIPVYINVSN